MRAALIFIVLVAIALFLSARPYPLDYSASGMEQRITALEARVDSIETLKARLDSLEAVIKGSFISPWPDCRVGALESRADSLK